MKLAPDDRTQKVQPSGVGSGGTVDASRRPRGQFPIALEPASLAVTPWPQTNRAHPDPTDALSHGGRRVTRCHVRSTVQSAGKTTLDGGSASQGGADVGGVPLCPPPPAASVCVGPAASGTGCHAAWSIRTQCPTASPLSEPSRRWCERGFGDGVSGGVAAHRGAHWAVALPTAVVQLTPTPVLSTEVHDARTCTARRRNHSWHWAHDA